MKMLLAATTLALLGCSQAHPTNAALHRVQTGMSEDQVTTLLGRPARVETAETLGLRGSAYLYDQDAVKVVFLNHAVFACEGNFKN